jgi:hypothetical protein
MIDPVRHLPCDVRHEHRRPRRADVRSTPGPRTPSTRRTLTRRPLGQYRPKATNNASFANWRGDRAVVESVHVARDNGGDITVWLAVP